MKDKLESFNKGIRKTFKKPGLRPAFGKRQASWGELFFDLIFVAAFGVLNTVNFHHGISLSKEEFYFYCLGFISLWLIWMSVTFYNNQFEKRTLRHRLVLLVNILTVGILTYGINDQVVGAVNTQGLVYLFGYILSRLILIFTWRNPYSEKLPENIKTLINRLTLIYLVPVSFGIITAVLFIIYKAPIKWGIILWSLGLAFEFLAVPISITISQRYLTTIHREHIVERFGLLTMLLLGEVIINALGGFRENMELSYLNIFQNMNVILFIFMFWWIYYDQVMIGAYQEDSRSRMIWTVFQFMFALTTLFLSTETRSLTSSLSLSSAAKDLTILTFIMFFITLLALSISIDLSDIIESEELGAEGFNIPLPYKILNGLRILTVFILIWMFNSEINSTVVLTLMLNGIMIFHILIGLIAEKSLDKYGSKINHQHNF